MNDDQLSGLCNEVVNSHPWRVFDAALKSMIRLCEGENTREVMVVVIMKSFLVQTHKRRGGSDLNLEEAKRAQKEGYQGYYLPKVDNERYPVQVWYIRASSAQGGQVNGSLHVLREVMLIWWSRNLTQGLCKFLN